MSQRPANIEGTGPVVPWPAAGVWVGLSPPAPWCCVFIAHLTESESLMQPAWDSSSQRRCRVWFIDSAQRLPPASTAACLSRQLLLRNSTEMPLHSVDVDCPVCVCAHTDYLSLPGIRENAALLSILPHRQTDAGTEFEQSSQTNPSTDKLKLLLNRSRSTQINPSSQANKAQSSN